MDMQTDQTEAADKNTVTLDPSQLGGAEYKAGEQISLKVVGHTSDGLLECEHVAPEKKTGWEDDFDQSMSPAEPMPQDGATDGGGAEEVT